MNEIEATEYLLADPQRSVLRESGEWRYNGTFYVIGDGTPFTALPPGTYYPLQPGTELSADLAWAYLSADEKRRCVGDSSIVRIRASRPQCLIDDQWEDMCRLAFRQRAPYTILHGSPIPDAEERAETAETERDRLRAERDATVTALAEYGHLETSKHLADSVRGALKAERDFLEREKEMSRRQCGKLTDQLFELQRSHKKLESETKANEATIRDLRAELAPYQLPADGEPLTLVQRAVALEVHKREVTIGGGEADGNGPVRLTGNDFTERTLDGHEYCASPERIFDPSATVTLLPLPTPEPRQLTFAEAVALGRQLAGRSEYRVMATWDEYEMRSIAGCGVAIRWRDMSYALQPEMLAATWTEVPRG